VSLPAAAPVAAASKTSLGALVATPHPPIAVASPATVPTPVAARPGPRDPRADDAAASNPFVRQLAELFDATIVGISAAGTLAGPGAVDEAPASPRAVDDGPPVAGDEPDEDGGTDV
jgi:hypothetical protein